MEAHDDQGPLVEALDAWFAVLRKRLRAPVPLKPATRGQLAKLRAAFGPIPPDVVALYEYSNGAWRDRKTPMRGFIPNDGRFDPINPYVLPITSEIGDEGASGYGYDDLPGRDYLKHVPIIEFDSGDQLSVMSAESCFQAVGCYTFKAIWWPARRLSDFFRNAVELENRGLLDWSRGLPLTTSPGQPCVYDPDLQGPELWRWEPIGCD